MDHWVVEDLHDAGMQRLASVDADQDRAGRIQAPLAQVGEQIGHHGRVLGAAFDQSQGMLGAVDADTQSHNAQVLTEVDPVDHQRHQVQLAQRCGEQIAQGSLGHRHEPA